VQDCFAGAAAESGMPILAIGKLAWYRVLAVAAAAAVGVIVYALSA